jgi:hypothetical protein
MADCDFERRYRDAVVFPGQAKKVLADYPGKRSAKLAKLKRMREARTRT